MARLLNLPNVPLSSSADPGSQYKSNSRLPYTPPMFSIGVVSGRMRKRSVPSGGGVKSAVNFTEPELGSLLASMVASNVTVNGAPPHQLCHAVTSVAPVLTG